MEYVVFRNIYCAVFRLCPGSITYLSNVLLSCAICRPFSRVGNIKEEETPKYAFICTHISLVSASYLTEEENLHCLCTLFLDFACFIGLFAIVKPFFFQAVCTWCFIADCVFFFHFLSCIWYAKVNLNYIL